MRSWRLKSDRAADRRRPRTSGPIHHMLWLASTRNWVGSGSSPPRFLNIFSKIGTMKIRTRGDQHERERQHDRRVGQRALDLAAQRGVLLEAGRDLLERVVDHAAGLAGPDHGDHQPREDPVVLGHARPTARRRPRRRCGPRRSPSSATAAVVCSSRIASERSSDMPDAVIVANCRAKTARSLSLVRLPRPGILRSRVQALAGLAEIDSGTSPRWRSMWVGGGLVRRLDRALGLACRSASMLL